MRSTFLLLALLGSVTAVTEEYKKRAKEWKKQNTKDNFIEEFNKRQDQKLSGPAADRLWAHLNEQLDNGGVVFKDAGSIVYSLPMTHFIPLPDFFVDCIDAVLKPLRLAYYKVMDAISDTAHETHHELMEYLQEKGVLAVLQVGMLSFIALNFLRWLVYRFTDGIFPSERQLAKSTRELAAAYKAKKNN